MISTPTGAERRPPIFCIEKSSPLRDRGTTISLHSPQFIPCREESSILVESISIPPCVEQFDRVAQAKATALEEYDEGFFLQVFHYFVHQPETDAGLTMHLHRTLGPQLAGVEWGQQSPYDAARFAGSKICPRFWRGMHRWVARVMKME